TKRRLQCRQRELVHAERARHRIRLERGDEALSPGEDSRLGAAEQFVSAEADQRHALIERIARDRFRGQSPSREIDERAASQILEEDRKSTRLNSSHVSISYAVFCLKK